MVVRGLFAFTIAIGVGLTARAAMAQDAAAPSVDEDEPPPGSTDAETEAVLADAEARANFEAGRAAFAAARYGDALTYFGRAHELSGRYELLYNIGLCHDRLGHDAEALASFEGYLAAAPEAHNRAEVEQRITTARERLARTAALTPPPVAPAPASPSPAPWIVLGVGVAAMAGGAAMLGVGRADVAAIEATPDGARSWASVAPDVERADLLTGLGAAFLGVGGAAAIAGLAWGIAAPGGSEGSAGPSPGVSLRVSPTGLELGGTF